MPTNSNNVELLVKLGIDKSNKTDLQTQVDQLGKTLSGLKVNINIDQKAISALEKLSTMDFSKLTSSVQKTTKEVENMAVKSTKEVQDSIKKASEALGMNFSKAAQSGFKDVEAIKRELKSLSPNIKVDFDVVDGKKQLDKIKASFERDGVTTTVKFQKSTLSDNGKDSSIWMPKEIQEMDRSLSLAAKNVDDLVKKMNKLQTEGKISNEQFEKLTSSISNIDKNGGMRGLNAQLDQFVVNNKKAEQAVREQAKAQKEQEAELRRQQQAQQKILDNEIKRKNLIIDIERAMKSQTRTIDSGAARNLIEQTRQLDISSNTFGTSLRQNQSALRELRANATEASRSNIGVIESFKTAMQKFPIWMAASTVFYSLTRGATDLTRKVIELDTAMVNIRRVMDMPDYKFNEMLEKSIVNVDELSGKLTDYLTLVNEFGRMGFNDLETLDMSNTAQMLTNISDLNADESVSSLVAAMTAFNITAEDSVDIADKLNQVDNEYSITTKDLAQSMNKSAATAKVFGVSLEQLLGYTTAIGAATRESGNIVGNSLKTIFSRITTKNSAASALSEIGVSINDLEGQVRPVADILDELGGKWNQLSKEEQQNTAIKVAGTHQLSRFNALMLNYQTAVDATTTAMNAQGSASREQEKYNQSLEARINRLSTAWYGLADSVGQSILYDGIVVVTKAFEGAAKSGESSVASFGALPILFGTIGSAVALLSTRFSTWTGTMIANRATALATTATNGSLSASLLGVAASSTVAQRALMMTGVGIALAAVAGAITLVTSAVSKNIQEQEEFELYMKKNTEALGENRQATEDLISRYNDLTQAKEEGSWSTEKEEEYLAVQQELGEVFPSLIKHIDSTGRSHIKNKEAIEAEIKATEDLIDAQNRSIIENANEEFEKLNEEISGKWYESFSNYIYGSLESRIKQQKSILETMYKNDVDSGAIAEEELKLKQLERQYQQISEEIKGHIFTVANAMSDIKISNNLTDMLQQFIGGLDINLDSTELESFAKEIGNIQLGLQKAINNGDTEAFNALIAKLNEIASETGNFDGKYDELSATLEDGNIKISDTTGLIHVLTDTVEEASEEVGGLEEAFKSSMSTISNLNSLIEELSEGNGLTADSMNTIMAQYPDLLSYIDDEAGLIEQLIAIRDNDVDVAKKQISEKMSMNEKFYNDNLKALELYFNEHFKFYDGDLSQFKNLAQAKAEVESELITKLAKQWGVYYNTASASFDSERFNTVQKGGTSAWLPTPEEFNSITKANSELTKFRDTWNNFTLDKINLDFNSIGTKAAKSLGSSTKDVAKATKEANKETKESIYIANKYKQALELVNAEIEKQKRLREDQPNYSKIYQDSLQKEIKLEQDKKKLQEDQAAALEKQIKSGKILQTGTISPSSTTSTSTQKLNGWGGKVTSGYGSRKDPFTGQTKNHAGVDLAGSRGTRLDANVSGRVVFAGKGKGSTAGYGNYVTIQAEDGMKHIYAHLDKVVATLGQTISAGMQVGTIGSTGRSTGSHLHYQVNNSKGKSIDPTTYMQAAKSGKVTTTKNVASGVSNAQQDIDQAKSDLLALRGEIEETDGRITNLSTQSIQGYLDDFNRKRQDYQHTLDYENAKQEAISQTGKEYRASIDKQITAMNGQQSANQAELAFLEKLMVTGNLSASAMANMKDRTRELKIEMQQLGTAIEGANFEKIQSRMQAFDESQDDLQFIVDLTGEYMQTLTEGSEEYNKAANEQIAAMQKQQRMIRTQIDEHKNDLATKKLSAQATKDLQEKIEDLTISYWSLTNGIRSSSESLKEANLRMANEVADKLIASYKNYTEERKNAHMKTIEAEMKAEDKRHKQVVDSLNKELEAYRKIIQARLDMLDKEESERDYNKEIDDLEKERLDTLSKINLLSMDDSFEARKQVAELMEKLNQTEDQIAEKRHDREIELRKENLNDLLDKKEEEIKGRQELEDQRYEHEKELIDKQKEYWEQYYNDLLNDERKFAKLREDVIAGNTDAIKAEFGEILTYFNETMPELENTLDGTMQAVGTSIRQNMIDNLKEAIDLMNQLGQNTPGNIPNTGQFNSDKGNGSPSTSPTVPPATGSPSGTKGTGLITVTKPINLWERKRGTDDLKMLKVLQPGEQFRVYGEESRKSFGKQYDVGANRWITDIPTHIKYSKFEKGGYTGMQEGWAQLHPEEFVLNKGMTKEALKMADLFENLRRFINPIRMTGVSQPQLAGASNGDGDVVINFNIDKMNATKNEADSFSKRIQDTLKRNKGVR